MRDHSLPLLCLLFSVSMPVLAPAQTPRFTKILQGLIADLADSERSWDAVDRLQAIGAPAIPSLLAVIDPQAGSASWADARRRVLALASLGRMGRYAVSALPVLQRHLPGLNREAARECVLTIGEIGPFAQMHPKELKVDQPWFMGPSYTVARMRLIMGPRPTPALVSGALRSCPIAAFQVLRRGLCPEFEDEALLIEVFRNSSVGFSPRGSAMPVDAVHEQKSRLAWELEEAAATVVHYTEDRKVKVEAYQVLLYHRDWRMRRRAASQLSDLVQPADHKTLALHVVYALEDRSPPVQRAVLGLVPQVAADALAALPAVQRYRASVDADVRAAATAAHEALRPVLDAALGASSAAVRPLERFAAYWPSAPEPVLHAARQSILVEGAGALEVEARIRRTLADAGDTKTLPGEVAVGLWRLRAVLTLLEANGPASVGFAEPTMRLLARVEHPEVRLAACRAIGAMGAGVAEVVPEYRKHLVAGVQSKPECAIVAEALARIEVREAATKRELIELLDDPNGLVRGRCLALLGRLPLDETEDAAAFAKVLQATRGQHWIRIAGLDRDGGKVTRDVRAAAAQLLWTKARSAGLRQQAARVLYEWGSVAQRRAVTPFYVAGKPEELVRLLRWCLAKEEDPALVADALALALKARPPLSGIGLRLRQLRKSEHPELAALAAKALEALAR